MTSYAATPWYELLDSRYVGPAENGWQLRVYCVVPEGAHTWVQLSLVGAPTYTVLMRVDPSADLADMMWALEQWLESRRTSISTDRIIDVCGARANAGGRRLVERRAQKSHIPSRYPLRATL